jgi:DNA-binding IclR family transcriptional regulator
VLLASLEPARLERFLGGTLERPTAATITNRVLLRSEIERVRAQGYAVMVDELEDGLASVSVPIREGGGELAATLNVTGPSFRFDAEHRTAALALMLAAASQIEGTLPEDLARSGLTQAPRF